MISTLREALREAQVTMEQHENRFTKETEFEVGSKVYLSTTNLSSHHFQQKAKKLRPAKVGPFEVIERLTLNGHTYKLQLPKQYKKLHPVFHAALLQKYVERDADLLGQDKRAENDGQQQINNERDVVPTRNAEQEVYYIEKVVSRKKVGNTYHYLVKWEDYDDESNTYITKKEAVSEEAYEYLKAFDEKMQTETDERNRQHNKEPKTSTKGNQKLQNTQQETYAKIEKEPIQGAKEAPRRSQRLCLAE